MSNFFSVDMVWTQFDCLEVEGRKVAVCKHCRRHLTGNRGAMCMHLRMKHNYPAVEAPSQVEPPPKQLIPDASTSELLTDTPTCKPLPHTTISEPVSSKATVCDKPVLNVGPLLPEKQAKDAVRYLMLCASSPTAFRRAIDVLPKSSIRRIYDVVCNVGKGQAQVKLSPKQCRLCSKYIADSRASSKTKRRLLRGASKQTVHSVFAPLMMQTVLDAFVTSAAPTTV